MEFEFDINQIIPYNVTKYTGNLRLVHPKNLPEEQWHPQLDWGQRKNLGYVIDRMGEASSRAQGLREIITSTQRLQISELHRVYLMKDPQANGGKGSVVGLLKVGEKNLFVYDAQGRNHEMKPTCVLDFFVNEKIQRRGYGKALFDYMLESEGLSAAHMAIDKPSEKSVRFLRKHYGLKNPISQVNNFVVFDGFFRDRANNNVFVRNKRSMQRNAAEIEMRKFSAEPSYNRTDQIGLDFKTVLNRTGSVDSRYYNRADNLATAAVLNNNQRQTGYTPDFSKHQQNGNNNGNGNNLFKHLNGQMESTGGNKQFQDTYGISTLNLDSMFRSNQRNEQTLHTFDSVFKTNIRSERSEAASQQNPNHSQSNRSTQNYSPSPMNQQYNKAHKGHDANLMGMSKSNPSISQNGQNTQMNLNNFNSPSQNLNHFSASNASQFYQPFPSIHTNSNDMNMRVTSKPPLPSYNKEASQQPVSPYHNINFPAQTAQPPPPRQNSLQDINRNYTDLTLNRNMTRYEPFPSLNPIKTVPEFYGAQSGNYRKTRLW